MTEEPESGQERCLLAFQRVRAELMAAGHASQQVTSLGTCPDGSGFRSRENQEEP